MYANKDYRDHGAARLVSYIDKERGLRNRRGKEMTSREVKEFIERSEQHEYEEQWQLSPANGNTLSDDQLSLATRKIMSDHLEDRPTGTYCYAIHDDTDHRHVQVAVTGEKADLWTDKQDLERLKERARECFREKEYHRERLREQGREQERERDRNAERENRRERSRGFSFW